ncbi:MAG: hypothetical protein WAQ33_12455 [Gaiellaceae bacterium]
MADRLPAPADLGDLQTVVLPSRACLLSIRDMLCDARRGGLADAVQAARRSLKKKADRDRQSAAALEAVWECVACLELAATVAAPWVDPQLPSPSGSWVEMTRYDPGRANRFYESSHKWTDERFGVLSAHRFRHGQDESLLDMLRDGGVTDERLLSAFAEAEAATAHLLRSRFETLAQAWKQMRAYAAAFEHGLLLVPSDAASIVDENDVIVPHAIIVCETRKDKALGEAGESVEAVIDAAEHAGDLAIDLADHVADSRLRVVETLEFDGDEVYLRPIFEDPFPFWIERDAVSPETLEILQSNIRLAWVRTESNSE